MLHPPGENLFLSAPIIHKSSDSQSKDILSLPGIPSFQNTRHHEETIPTHDNIPHSCMDPLNQLQFTVPKNGNCQIIANDAALKNVSTMTEGRQGAITRAMKRAESTGSINDKSIF